MLSSKSVASYMPMPHWSLSWTVASVAQMHHALDSHWQ